MGTSDGTVVGATKILDNGPDDARFNLVLVAEGFQDTEQGIFDNACNDFVNQLESEPWFDTLISAINIHRINVESDESGADDPATCTGGTGVSRRTYFDASYCWDGQIRRLLACDDSIVLDVADQHVPEWHNIIVIVNSIIFGGAGGTIAVVCMGAGWIDVAMHELGHAAFGLADEYQYYGGCGVDTDRDHAPFGEPAEPNITAATTQSTLKWRHLVNPLTPIPTMENPDCSQCDTRLNVLNDDTAIGLFEGAGFYHCGLYRPAYTCRMRTNSYNFCRVCVEAIHDILRPFFGTSPALAAELNSIDFGSLGQGGIINTSFEINNVGQVDVTGINFSLNNPNYSATLLSANTTLAPGESAEVQVTLGPVMINGLQNDTLEIRSNAPTLNINLTALICTAQPSVKVIIEGGGTTLDFGSVSEGLTMYRSIEIRNQEVACSAPVEVTLSPLTGEFYYAPGTSLVFTIPNPSLNEDFTSQIIFVAFTAPSVGGPTFMDAVTIDTPVDTTTPTTTIQLNATSVPPPIVDSVLVLDRSGSMDDDTGDANQKKIDHAIYASELYVSLLKDNDRIGIVRYNDHSSEAQGDKLLDPVVAGPIDGGAGRNDAISKLNLANLNPSGATSIGAGIILGSKVLDNASADSRALIVLTDGRQNTIPDIPAGITEVQSKTPAQRVFAVGLGLNQLEDKLNEIATVTNGTAQITGDLVGDKEFYLQKLFVQILSDVANDAFITDPRHILAPNEAYSTDIHISEVDIAADFIMVFRTSNVYPKYIEIWLEAPNGDKITVKDILDGLYPNIKFSSHSRNYYFRLLFPAFPAKPLAHIGVWKFWVENKLKDEKASPFFYTVMAKARSDLILKGRLIQSEYIPDSEMKVILEPTLYGQPIEVDEPVEVFFRRPDGVFRKIILSLNEYGSYEGIYYDTSLYGSYQAMTEITVSSPKGLRIKRYRMFTGIILSSRTKYRPGIECCKVLVRKLDKLIQEVKKDRKGFLKT